MNYFFTKIFSLPALEKRRKIPDFLLRSKFFGSHFSIEKDDTYIFYLVFRSSLLIGWIYALLIWFIYLFKFDCNETLSIFCINQATPAGGFAYSFSFPFAVIQLFLIFPYYAMSFATNIDWKSYNFLWWNKKWKITDPIEKIYPLTRNVFYIFVIAQIFSGWGTIAFLSAKLHLDSSEMFLAFSVFFTPFIMAAIGCQWIMYGTMYFKAREILKRNNANKS